MVKVNKKLAKQEEAYEKCKPKVEEKTVQPEKKKQFYDEDSIDREYEHLYKAPEKRSPEEELEHEISEIELNEVDHSEKKIKELFGEFHDTRIGALRAAHPNYTRDECLKQIWHEFRKNNKELFKSK